MDLVVFYGICGVVKAPIFFERRNPRHQKFVRKNLVKLQHHSGTRDFKPSEQKSALDYLLTRYLLPLAQIF